MLELDLVPYLNRHRSTTARGSIYADAEAVGVPEPTCRDAIAPVEKVNLATASRRNVGGPYTSWRRTRRRVS
jgi:hypothetical protein